MKMYIGIWVDRKKAVIITIKRQERPYEEEGKIAVTQIKSDVERKVRLAGGSRTGNTPWGPQEIAVDSKIEARQKQQLKKYYHRIIECIKGADKIVIMGPGETKFGLKNQIEKSKTMASKIADLQTCDKMTDKQFAARVRSFFSDN